MNRPLARAPAIVAAVRARRTVSAGKRVSRTRAVVHVPGRPASDVAYCFMIEYQLVGMDLGEVRFAISPINEVSLSLRTFRDPGRYPLHLPWLQMTTERRDALHTDQIGRASCRERVCQYV